MITYNEIEKDYYDIINQNIEVISEFDKKKMIIYKNIIEMVDIFKKANAELSLNEGSGKSNIIMILYYRLMEQNGRDLEKTRKKLVEYLYSYDIILHFNIFCDEMKFKSVRFVESTNYLHLEANGVRINFHRLAEISIYEDCKFEDQIKTDELPSEIERPILISFTSMNEKMKSYYLPRIIEKN